MNYKISNNKLIGQNIDFKESPNKGMKFKKNELDTIILHYTAGSSRTSSVNTLCNPISKASAHIVIGRDEKITQLVSLDTIAWHAGESSHNGRSGLNKYSIGIEIDNAGILTKSGDLYSSWFGKDYKIEDVIFAKHRNRQQLDYWHKYTEWQIEKCFEICQLLIEKYDIKYLLGHEEISPTRKIDPGPAFPLDKFRDRLFYQDRSIEKEDTFNKDEVVVVQIDDLNIREQANASSLKISSPLELGKELTIIETKGKWIKVKTDIIGWVNSKYVTKK